MSSTAPRSFSLQESALPGVVRPPAGRLPGCSVDRRRSLPAPGGAGWPSVCLARGPAGAQCGRVHRVVRDRCRPRLRRQSRSLRQRVRLRWRPLQARLPVSHVPLHQAGPVEALRSVPIGRCVTGFNRI